MVSLVLSASTQAQNLTDSGVLRMERKFNRVLQMVHSQITTNIDYRQVNRMVENYGCYCFPNRGNLGSSGPAQDEYCGDKTCSEKCDDVIFSPSYFRLKCIKKTCIKIIRHFL